MEWYVLRLLLVVLDPFMYVRKNVESNKVTASFVVLLIWDLRTSFTDVLDDLREATPDKDEDEVSQVRAMLLSCVQALLKDHRTFVPKCHDNCTRSAMQIVIRRPRHRARQRRPQQTLP